ncbi:hypothetical protein M8C21_008890 [Ambrosia artemisiifolia]|uniref:UDP-glucuronosyl/UDP-glucosyltransferase n=1 Tax=Ambrosia artemisiifolia TaxID=4212 RepID=A0AAD5CHK4_AMBAR|nr:hypothetical protein M8C21_008890 [Ambrosia artemisiifolia]
MNQVVVVPYPGRGHINPMLNLCHLLSSRLNRHNRTTIFTVVVTEEWLGFLNPDSKQDNIRFVTIPNVLPSELNRGSDMIGFLTAAQTKMERPFVELLDRIEFPVKLIIADVTMRWPFDVANRRNIPIAAYWPMSASMFSVVYHVDLLESNHQLFADVLERGRETIDYIPGLSSLTIADLPTVYHSGGEKFKGIAPSPFGVKANYVLISTMYELESKAINGLRSILQMPIYTSGPNIPYSQIEPNPSLDQPVYINWLNSKPPKTVLYVSFGSFLSVSCAEMAEIAFGLTQSGVNFLWVARGETSRLKEICGDNGMVVEWCDQLRVLLHSSIGGFWTHCGWNSVKESLFSGVPMLAFPISLDQTLNNKMIVKDWKTGWNIREKVKVLKRDEIAKTVRDFMDSKSVVRIEMMERVEMFSRICQESVGEDGSINEDLDAFVRDIAMS